MPLIYLDDIRLNAVVEGPAHAPAILFCHALGTDLSIWDETVAALSPRYRCIRYDGRGHGASDVPAPPYSMGALIRDAEKVLAHFGARDAVVIGSSMGGLVAQGLATKRFDLVRAMVLANTAVKIGGPTLWQTRAAEVAETGLAAYAPGAMERIFGRHWASAPAMPRIRTLLEATDPQGWIGSAHAIAGADFYTTTAALGLPTLVIAGSNDGSTPTDLVRETADLIRGHQWALMRGTGHLPMVENPSAFIALVDTFLTAIGHG
jgi:3-oxoadipate enol-lactonase